MRIDLADIAGTPGARGSFAISELIVLKGECELAGPVVGELEVENTGSLMLLRGWLRGVVRANCVRCLTPCECPVEMELEEEFATPDTERDVMTMDREEPATSAIEDYVLDVAELVRQQLVASLPIAQFCRQDCRGICPQCGRNLNEGPCACAVGPTDSGVAASPQPGAGAPRHELARDIRWGRLGELLEEESKRE